MVCLLSGENFIKIEAVSQKLSTMERERREKILHTHVEKPTWSGVKIAKFLKYPKSTVNSVLQRYRETLTVDRAKQTRRKSGTYDRKLRAKVIRSVHNNPGISFRDLAKKFKTNHSTARRICLREGLRSYHASKHPNRTLKQNLVAKTRARKLYEKVLTKYNGCILMDDETYVKMDFGQIPGNKFYLAKRKGNVAGRFKFVFADKFARKLMIWQGICSCGKKTKTFITGDTMNGNVYKEECLQKRVLPFIRSHRGPVKFWPDLASCHYSRDVVKWYKENKIDFVEKSINPPNCPDFRPIEKYWAIVKGKLKKCGRTMKKPAQMEKWWNKMANEVTSSTVQKMMGGITKKVRKFIRKADE